MSPPMDSEAVAQDTPSNGQAVAAAPPTAAPKTGTDKVDRAELKQNLDPIEYYVTQEKGTEK